MANQPARPDDPLRGKKTGKWTKYGGAVYGLVKERIEEEWTCQTCANDIPAEIKPFLFEMTEGEFIRICPACTHKASRMPYTVSVQQIIRVVRIRRD